MSNLLAHVLDAKWRSDDVNTNEGKDFSSLNLDERILAGLRNAGYRIPSPVQLQAIPLCLTGDDVFFQGKAGTGKTLVFSILALTAILESEDIQVLIIAPTREAAFQIYNTIQAIGSEIKNLNCECFIGGFSYTDDVPKTRDCKIAIGTPGRLLHLIEEDKLKIDKIRLSIIDDFDELLNKHFKPDVSDIFQVLPENKQTVVASLTCTDEVMELTSEFLKPSFQTCCNENELSLLGMAHYYYIVPLKSLPLLSYRRKLEVLKNVLLNVKFSQCVVFCNSVHRVEPLCIDIQSWGFSAVSISKVKDQVERLNAVELLKKNKCRVLVSTDVSSRGLDAENVDLVVNFDMPYTCRVYLHRCGRAGRYGAKCSSLTFLLKHQIEEFDKIVKEGHFTSYALPEPLPENLNCDMNLSTTQSMPFNLTDSCKNATANLEKMRAREGSPVIAYENGDTSLEDVKSCSVAFAQKFEEQTVDLETVNTNSLGENFEIIQPENYSLKVNINQQPEVGKHESVRQDEEDVKSCSVAFAQKFEEQTVDLETVTTNSLGENSEIIQPENYSLKVNINQQAEVCKHESVRHTDSIESLEISSGSKTSEIEKVNLKKIDTGKKNNSCEETDIYSASETVPKSIFKSVSTSKMSEEYALHKALDKMHLGREGKISSKKVTKIPEVIEKKKKASKNTRNICNKKSAKSLDHCKSQRKSPERKVKFYGLKTSSSGFDANHSCTKRYSGHPSHNMDKKNVPQNHKPCHAVSQHCCHCPNYYCQHPLMYRNDIFYNQLMFINNFSSFISNYLL